MRRNLFILGLSLWLLLPQVAAFGDDFDADKTVGIAPLTVHFLLDCEAWTYFQQWSFGDGATLNERNPEHTYTKPGTYQVTVVYRHAGGLFDLTKTEFITVYPPCGLAPLKVVDGTPTVPNEDWSNAIDGDTNNNDGTVSALNGPAQAIFEFSDSQIRKITKIRLLSNSDIQYFHAIQQMSLAVSENGTNSADFAEISTSSVVQRGWTEINFPEISARYIKLTVNDQNSLPRRFNEFEVYTQFVPIDSQRSYLQISTPQVANGVDRAQITLFLFDAANQPITGKHQADINFHITGQNNYLHDFREVAPGQYVAYLTSMTAEEKYVSA
ncbi:PKD domain-containing protein, partial [candidate division KSB1 bacterium]|nr:PKD domain-containing protein [candidate division KSB1 bacterium]